MLAIFVGPSGSGKTTLMEQMCHRCDCVLLENFTTRDLRPHEQSRYHISVSEAQRLEEAGELEFLNEVYGNFYGVTRVRFEEALLSPQLYLFDIYWSHLYKVVHSVHCVVLFDEIDEVEINERLLADGRGERLSAVADDLSGIARVKAELIAGELTSKVLPVSDRTVVDLERRILECSRENWLSAKTL